MQKIEKAFEKIIKKHILLGSFCIFENSRYYWKEGDVESFFLKSINKRNFNDTAILDIETYFSEFQNKFLHMAYLIEDNGNNYILWVISHAIADGYSLSLLERELEKSITDESYELRFDYKEEKNEVIQPEFMNSSIELSIDYI